MINYDRIPPDTLETLQAWIDHARPMGSFCEAVVSNNLSEACKRADPPNAAALWEIVRWMYNEAPMGCWGSPKALTLWPEFLRGQVKS